jgi:hypothetical protein
MLHAVDWIEPGSGVCMRRVSLVLLSLVLAFAPGCGTLVGLAADRNVAVTTNPPGAQLLVDSSSTNQASPATLALDPADEHRIEARLDDMHSVTQVTRSTRTGVIIADVFLTAGLGLWIDYLTGALYWFPDRVTLNLGRVYPVVPPLAQEYPPAPALMPRTDPAAPPAKHAGPTESTSTTDLRRADAPKATVCPVCGAEVKAGVTQCPECGQQLGDSSSSTNLLQPHH